MENMACVITICDGGVKRGRHVATAGKHPVNVLITLLNAVGVPTAIMGEASGAIPDLRADRRLSWLITAVCVALAGVALYAPPPVGAIVI